MVECLHYTSVTLPKRFVALTDNDIFCSDTLSSFVPDPSRQSNQQQPIQWDINGMPKGSDKNVFIVYELPYNQADLF